MRKPNDSGVTAILGTMLMLAMMAVLMVPAMNLVNANKDYMAAQAEAAERAAFCARNPDIGPPTCPETSPMPGYECTYAKPAWVCIHPDQKPEVPAEIPEVPALGSVGK